jgi:lipoprotein-releasing system permease protein
MGGFGHQIKRMIIDTQGEVQIKGRALIDPTAGVEKLIAGVPEVAAFAAYAQGVVMLEFEHRPAFPAVQGFDLERITQVIPLEQYLVQGSLDDLDDDSVILSSLLAGGLGARVGDKVSLYTPLMLERMKKNEVLLPREVRVAGIFRIGHQQLDSSTVICPLSTASARASTATTSASSPGPAPTWRRPSSTPCCRPRWARSPGSRPTPTSRPCSVLSAT